MKTLKTYIGVIKVQEDEFISKRYLVNYINIGTRFEQRMDDLILDRFKLFNPQNNRNEFVSPLNNCIFYTEDEVKVLKKYHPDIVIIDSKIHLDNLNKLLHDLDVSERRLCRFLQ